MKKILILAIAGFIGFSYQAEAQSKVKKAGQEVKKGAKKVGNETAELATKGKAKLTDKKVKDKQGLKGETIYLDDKGYYWIDNKGKRHFVNENYLRAKVN